MVDNKCIVVFTTLMLSKCACVGNRCYGKECEQKGLCTVVQALEECFCRQGYVGKNFDVVGECVDIDECAAHHHDPCGHRGLCVNAIGNYTCNCLQGWSNDSHCSMKVSDPALCMPGYTGNRCNDATCGRHGYAQPKGRSDFECICESGWTGINTPNKSSCDRDIDECQDPYVCNQRSTCINVQGSYRCECIVPWSGEDCSIYNCSIGLCYNGGTCNNYKCTCLSNWTGEDCSISNCSTRICYNGGTCNNDKCTCLSNWTGEDCSISNCSTRLCYNGGTCNNDKCACLSNWTGEDCSIYNCNTSLCSNGGTCINDKSICLSYWTGGDCYIFNCTTNLSRNCESCIYDKCTCVSINNCTPGLYSNGGSCINDTCICLSNETGKDCALEICSTGESGNSRKDHDVTRSYVLHYTLLGLALLFMTVICLLTICIHSKMQTARSRSRQIDDVTRTLPTKTYNATDRNGSTWVTRVAPLNFV